MQDIRMLLGRIAPADVPVLIEGEPGTGRKLVARLLHEQSGRRAVHHAGLRRGRPARPPTPTALPARLRGTPALSRRRYAVPARDPCAAAAAAVGNAAQHGAGHQRRASIAIVPSSERTHRAGGAAALPRGPARPTERGALWGCRRCANAAATSRCSSRTSSPGCRPPKGCRASSSSPPKSRRSGVTTGRGTCANCATWWNKRYCAAGCRRTRSMGKAEARARRIIR